MACGGDSHVVSDAVDATNASELIQLEAALDGMDKAMATTMKSFNELISSIDRVGHIYNNLSVVCDEKLKERLRVFDTETRAMQEKGLYPSFNADVHSGSLAIFDTMKKEVKAARTSLDKAKKLQAEYESRRKKVEAKEADYAKKGKQISTDKDYQKNLKERDQKKASYEAEKTKFTSQMLAIRQKVSDVVVRSSSNYGNCVIAYFNYVGKVILPFTDPAQKPPKLTTLVNNYKAPTFSTGPLRPPPGAESLLVTPAPVDSKVLAPTIDLPPPPPPSKAPPATKAPPDAKAPPASKVPPESKAPPADAKAPPATKAPPDAKAPSDTKAPPPGTKAPPPDLKAPPPNANSSPNTKGSPKNSPGSQGPSSPSSPK